MIVFGKNPLQKKSFLTCKSLGAKFIIVVVAILAATMSASAYFNYIAQKQQLVKQLVTKGNMLGNFVALVSPDAILGYDFVLMDSYMKEISSREDIVYAVVISPENTNITSYFNKDNKYLRSYPNVKNIVLLMDEIKRSPDIIELSFPIKSDNELLGTVKIGVSSENVNVISEELLQQSLFQTFGTIFLLSICIYLVFRYNALRPIRDLIYSVEKVAQGDLQHKAKILSRDELGSLALAFNYMTDSLKISYDELSETNDALLAATKAKSAFLANMSHEIRTPLTAIIGFAELLLDSHVVESERISAISTIIRSGNHLKTVINDILDISKIEADKLDVELVASSPIEILKDVKDLISLQAKDKGLNFDVDYHFPLPQKMQTDPLRLKQVLINLCGNAIKFTQIGSVVIEVKCDVENQLMHFSVIDSGIGLEQDKLGSIFEPFAQADTSTTRIYGGTGLGLPLTKRLTKMLGGDVKVVSQIGVGSRFTATISTGPISECDLIHTLPVNIPDNVNEQPLILPRALTGDILLAEDNIDNQKLLKFYIEKTQANLTIVQNGHEVLDAVAKQSFDLVLMDMQMPVMDGATAVEKLREAGYQGRIVAITANTSQSDITRYNEIGCDGCVAKPIERNIFMNILKQHLPVDYSEQVQTVISSTFRIPDEVKLKGRILLAEDTLDNQRLIDIFVRKLGASLTIVENGKIAVETALSQPYDLILMDMQMPVMGGMEAISILKQRGCTTPIVALTANALTHDRESYESVGCADFIAKPINREVFIHTLSKFLPKQNLTKESIMVKVDSLTHKNEVTDMSPILSKFIDEPGITELVGRFIDSLPQSKQSINAALKSENWDDLQRSIHDIKGLGGSFGFPQLSNVAKDIHQLLKEKRFHESIPLMEDLNKVCDRIVSGRKSN